MGELTRASTPGRAGVVDGGGHGRFGSSQRGSPFRAFAIPPICASNTPPCWEGQTPGYLVSPLVSWHTFSTASYSVRSSATQIRVVSRVLQSTSSRLPEGIPVTKFHAPCIQLRWDYLHRSITPTGGYPAAASHLPPTSSVPDQLSISKRQLSLEFEGFPSCSLPYLVLVDTPTWAGLGRKPVNQRMRRLKQSPGRLFGIGVASLPTEESSS